MAGEGENKRKAPLELDFDALLAGDDGPPPVLVITHGAGEPTSPAEAGEAEPYCNDSSVTKLSDKELVDKIQRMSSGPIGPLKDGGARLRVLLSKLKAELARRNRSKEDNNRKKVIVLADEPTCNGRDNVISHSQAPPSSKFGRRFCSGLENQRTSFETELSTLHMPEYKKIREHRPFSALITQKRELTSRQAAFRSPTQLSVTSNQRQTNHAQRGSSDSSPSSHLSDKGAVCRSTTKDCGGHNLRPRGSRRNNQPFVVLDEEELEDDIVDEIDGFDPIVFSKDACIYYPSRDDPESIEICYSDTDCLAPESYLSSPVMNFYIRYLQKPTSPTPRMDRDIHIFNTFFYKKLKQDVLNKNGGDDSFSKFRRWWKGVNIFEKAYIFLPIHENLHWSLVIICIPNKEDESGPIILHLDSFGLHNSKSIFSNVKSFLIEEWNFLKKENVLPETFSVHIWENLSRRISEKVPQVPQQENGYDCGLFVLFFMERFIDEAPERLKERDLEFGRRWFRPVDASKLRRKILNLLKEEFRNAKEDACKLGS